MRQRLNRLKDQHARRIWRIAGGVCLLVALLMALYVPAFFRQAGARHWLLAAVYGAVFILVLMAALYIALLDMRFTRLQYKISERELFRDTFSTDSLKEAAKGARSKQQQQPRQEEKKPDTQAP